MPEPRNNPSPSGPRPAAPPPAAHGPSDSGENRPGENRPGEDRPGGSPRASRVTRATEVTVPGDPAESPAVGQETPLDDAVEQRTAADEDEDGQESADEVWQDVPDEADPADATEQKRPVGYHDDEDRR